MPRFYFDITDCGDPLIDRTGRELADMTAAREYAFKGLNHLAKHHCREEPFCDFQIRVRNEARNVVLIVSLQVQEGERLERSHAIATKGFVVEGWV